MSIGGQVALADVTLKDIYREATLWRHPAERAEASALATIEAITSAIGEKAIPTNSAVARLVRSRAATLRK